MIRSNRSRALALVAIGSASLLVAGCSSGSPTPGSSDDGSKDKGGTIGVAMPTVEGPFFTSMLYGITEEAKAAGYDVTILSAGGYGNISQQVDQIQNLITQQVDIIMTDPADPNATEPALKQAVSQGIIAIGAGDPAPGGLGYSAAGHCDVGKAMAVGAKELLPDGGTLGIMAGPAGAFWSTERLRCFKEDIAGAGIEIVAEKATNPDVAEGLNGATDMLQRFPDLDLLYGADDTVGVGAAKAVQAANKCGETKVLTAVYGQQAEDLMKQNCIQYDVGIQPVLIGREAVKLAIALKNGEKPTVTDIDIPLVAITPETMDSINLDDIRSPAGWKPAA
ncbi:MAG: monosaccharide transporter substrate-binding protein [Cryobacterium sp.]|jgi:ribose transport system substrate-binding protein|nr:monosaccharide transporter substrate-binding protein [Cryobacterium sp.]